ncbi:MAG: hypothetical protein LIO87_01140, partial [Eubacterium sp.]|nr:hypothetical protein [Eubacterium sp.]
LKSDDISLEEAFPLENSSFFNNYYQNTAVENYSENPDSFQGNSLENLSENYFNDAGDTFSDMGLSYSSSDNAFNTFENSEGGLSLYPVKNTFENALNNAFENESYFENTLENKEGGKGLISELLCSESGSSQSITNNINPTINLYTGGQSLENDIEEIAEKIGELLLEVCEGSCGGYYK